MDKPPIVSPREWEAARQEPLVKEKELTRSRDRLAAERRRMPWLAVQKEYEFVRPEGKACLVNGTNAFIRDGDRVFRTYLTNGRGDETMGSTWSYFDITALGRQEEWEDSPAGYPQTPPYEWWLWHDDYIEDVERAGLEMISTSSKGAAR